MGVNIQRLRMTFVPLSRITKPSYEKRTPNDEWPTGQAYIRPLLTLHTVLCQSHLTDSQTRRWTRTSVHPRTVRTCHIPVSVSDICTPLLPYHCCTECRTEGLAYSIGLQKALINTEYCNLSNTSCFVLPHKFRYSCVLYESDAAPDNYWSNPE